MELAIIITVGVLFFLFGLVCVISVALGLPGTWLLLFVALLIELADTWWITTRDEQTFGWWLIIVCLVLASIGELLEFIAGALGAKHAGSSRRGMWGAVIGGLIGAVVGVGIPIPIVGAVIGTFIGAVVGELGHHETNSVRETIKPATGATIGKVLGTLSKLPIAVAVWAALSIAALWP